MPAGAAPIPIDRSKCRPSIRFLAQSLLYRTSRLAGRFVAGFGVRVHPANPGELTWLDRKRRQPYPKSPEQENDQSDRAAKLLLQHSLIGCGHHIARMIDGKAASMIRVLRPIAKFAGVLVSFGRCQLTIPLTPRFSSQTF